MTAKRCTKCSLEKPLTEFADRSDRSGKLSACKECERERGRLYQAQMRGTMKGAYLQQKSNAKRRGIPFELTFAEWKDVWEQSGKWASRGRGIGTYCMCRVGDNGPYAVGNVFIGPNQTNVKDGNIGKQMSQATRDKISITNSGKSRPWVAGDKNPMHRPEVKAKMAEAIGGTKHYRSKGGVNTPNGFFESTKKAAEALGIPLPTIQWRCRHNKLGFSYRDNNPIA